MPPITLVFLDMDGVLADFVGAACKVHGNRDPSAVQTWDFWEPWGLTADEFWAPIRCREFWASVPPIAAATSLVWEYQRLYGAERVAILTNPGRAGNGGVDGKIDWITEHLPNFPRDQVIFTAAKQFCAAPGHLLVDDSPMNCKLWQAYGGEALLWAQPWNVGDQ